jgi:hypothetical protein
MYKIVLILQIIEAACGISLGWRSARATMFNTQYTEHSYLLMMNFNM